jgi:endo-1,4-beta-xylanase
MLKRSFLLFCLGMAGLPAALSAQTSLKDAFKKYFYVGAALNPGHFTETNAIESALVKQQFNSTTPENDMKWERIHPRADAGLAGYNFENADKYVEGGEIIQAVENSFCVSRG